MASITPINGISVSGEGTVTIMPDVAKLNVGVEVQTATFDEARSVAADAMQALLDRLAALGIEKRDIITQWVNFSPVYRPRTGRSNRQDQIEGYRVFNFVRVTVNDMNRVSSVIDGAVAVAGDAVRLHGIEFGIKNQDDAVRQARELAMKDARGKAEHLSELSGVRVGKPIHIHEDQGGGRAYRGGVAFAKAAVAESSMPTPVEPGETTVTVNVDVIFAIE